MSKKSKRNERDALTGRYVKRGTEKKKYLIIARFFFYLTFKIPCVILSP